MIRTSVLVAALLMTSGCGDTTTLVSADGSMTMSQQGDSATFEIKGTDGKAAITVSDDKIAIPDTFPKDVPILEGAVPKTAMHDGKNELLHLEIARRTADVVKDYRTRLEKEGWKLEPTIDTGFGSVIQAKKGSRECSVTVLDDDSGKGAFVQITVTQQ